MHDMTEVFVRMLAADNDAEGVEAGLACIRELGFEDELGDIDEWELDEDASSDYKLLWQVLEEYACD